MLEAFRELTWKRNLGTGMYEEAYLGYVLETETTGLASWVQGVGKP